MIEDKVSQSNLQHRTAEKNDKKILKYRLELLTYTFFHRLTIKEDELVFNQVKRAQLTAKFLIDKEGVFHPEFIDKAIEHLHHEIFTRQQKRAVKHLKWLKTSSADHIFKMIQEISTFSVKVKHIIVATLGIKSEKQLKGYHASRAALAALLSPFYQGPVGNCFSFFLGSHLLENLPQRCLIDFYHVIKTGKLSIKNQEEEEIKTPVTLSIPHESLTRSFPVYLDGSLLDGDYTLMIWQVPSLAQIGYSLGIKNISKAFLEVIDQHRIDQKFYEPINITAKEFIKGLSSFCFQEQKQERRTHISKEQLERVAILAYESCSKNSLLEVWNYSLSSLSESTPYGIYKVLLIQRLRKCLDAFFQTKIAKDYINSWNIISTDFYHRLSNMVYYRYDASLSEESVKHGQGAFVLYMRTSPNLLFDIKRIDKQYHFQKLLVSVYDTTLFNLEDERSVDTNLEMDLLIKKHFNSDQFIRDILTKYMTKEEKKLLDNFNDPRISSTPWRIFSGHYAKSTIKSYLGTNPTVMSLENKTTEGLLESLFKFCLRWKHLPKKDFKRISLPLVIPELHACNLCLKDAKFFEWLKSDLPFEVWLEKLIELGKQVAETPLNISQLQKLIQFVCHQFLNQEKEDLFMRTVKDLDERFPLFKLRDYLLDHLQIYGFKEKLSREKIQSKIDLFILTDILDKSQKKKILETAIPFARSNWEKEGKEIDIGFLYNPASRRFELWSMDEDKLIFGLLSKEWFKKNNWEIYMYEKDFITEENERLYSINSTK